MNSLDFSLTIIHGDDYTRAKIGVIDSSQIHRVTLSTVHWIPKNFFVLINESMRQRLGLGFDKTLPPQVLGLVSKDILESPGPYRTCECVYLSTASTHPIRAIANPALVPDLPVDFVLGTMFFKILISNGIQA